MFLKGIRLGLYSIFFVLDSGMADVFSFVFVVELLIIFFLSKNGFFAIIIINDRTNKVIVMILKNMRHLFEAIFLKVHQRIAKTIPQYKYRIQ